MNNRGQSLVLFVLIIPILLGIMAMVIDLGNAYVLKNSLDNITELVLDYSLDNSTDIKDTDIIELMNLNTKKEISSVINNGDTIILKTEANINGIYSNLFNIPGFRVVSKYNDYIKNNKKIIQKEI